MPPINRRRGARPDSDDLGELARPATSGRLQKAAPIDPVLMAGSGAPADPAEAGPKAAAAVPPKSPAVKAEQRPTKPKVGYYQDHEDTERARAAWAWTHTQEGHVTWSDFIASTLMREVERLEHKYNGGKPFEPRKIGTGRPVRP